MKRTATAFLLVLVAFAPAASALTADTVNLGSNHGLATDNAIESFEEDDIASTSVDQYQLRITVAEDSGDVGLESWKHSDTDHVFVRLQYNESIPRTFRFELPSEMIYPHMQQDIDGENADVTMDLEPGSNPNMTAVTVHLEGKTDVVFSVSKFVGAVYRIKGTSSSFIENVTGFDMPSLSAQSSWSYINESRLSGDNTTATIVTNDAEVTVQYDNDPTPAEESWIGVPECNSISGDSTPVCTFTRENESHLYVLSRTDDPPQVRYQEGGSIMADLSAAMNDLTNVYDRVKADISSLFGGDE